MPACGTEINMFNIKLLLVFVVAFSLNLHAQDKGFSFVKFGKAANMGLSDKTPRDHKGGWFDQGPHNDLSKLPGGIQKFNGIPFQIKAKGKSCVILRGHTLKFFPLDSGPIKVNRKAQIIYFLTACGWNASLGEKVAFITVRYKQGGLYLDIPLRYKKETSGWWNPEKIPNAEIAWRGQNGSAEVGLYSFGWINPNPEQEIDTITFVSTNSSAVPAFIAATMVTDKKLAAKLGKPLLAKLKAQNTTVSNKAKVVVGFDKKGIKVADDAASISLGFWVNDNYLKAAKALVKAGKGKPFFRLQIGLANPSPAKGVWDFKRLDEYLDFMRKAGGEPIFCFGPTGPIWMAKPVKGISMRRNWRPQNIEEYAKYCEGVVRYYNIKRKTPVKWWQIGNETELKGWSYRYYVKVYKYIAPRLKKIDPSIKIGGPVNCSPNVGWASELLREAGSEVDFLSYHKYGYSEPFDSPSDYAMKRTEKFENSVRRYRKAVAKITTRNLPVIVTEANTNPRYQKPKGTDPRIRTMFNAAFYMSALCRFVSGGGRSLCYFTLDGGFGACCNTRKGFKFHPVFHSIWLFRKLGQGRIIQLKSSNPLVEAYAFTEGKTKRLIVINKAEKKVEVELSFKSVPGKGMIYRLNKNSAEKCAYFDKAGRVKLLKPTPANFDKKIKLEMSPYEIAAWQSK